MIKKIAFLIFIITATIAFADEKPNKPIIGEIAMYDIIVDIEGRFKISGKVGQLQYSIRNINTVMGIKAYHCTTDVRSLPIIDPVYKLRDYYDVWADTNTLRPIYIKQKVHEGSWTNRLKTILYQKEGYATFSDKLRTNHRFSLPSDTNVTVPSTNTFDIVSIINFLRFKKNKDGKFEANWVEKWYTRPIAFEYERARSEYIPGLSKDKVKLIKAVQLEEAMYGGFEIYLAPEYNYIPVRVIVPGFQMNDSWNVTVKGELTGYYNPKTMKRIPRNVKF